MKNYIPKTFRQILAMLLCVAMVLPMAAVPGYATEVTEPTVSVIAETQPETTVPETTAPEATVPETTVPETTAPEATVPETTVPETTAPEATVPETTESEESVPETTAPEVSEERPMMMMMMSSGKSPLAVVYAASDFQPYKYNSSNTKVDDVEGGMNVMNAIIDTMQTTRQYTIVNGALFCGDYSNRADTWGNDGIDQNNAGQAAVARVLSEQWQLGDDQVVYVQGNHDPANTNGLDPSGNNDTAHYGVFVIHEDDFQWKQGDDISTSVSNSGNDGNDAEETTKATAVALEAYLKEKAEQKYNKPIFVCAHVPLHFGWRTAKESLQDNIYAKYIFDVLNKYGEKLDIIYLFGHDHSDTYDDYLGGAAVYLPVGAEIWIPDTGSRSTWSPYKLTFTYMNAGYLGYYGGEVYDSDGSLEADTGMSSTIFAIYEDKVVISRFDEDSEENLKNKGEKTSDDTWSGAAANTAEYASPQTITLKTFTEELKSEAMSAGVLTKGNSAEVSVAGIYGKTYTVEEWGTSNADIAEVTASESDPMAAIVTAKKSGNVKITARITEVLPTRAVGDTKTLTMDLEVVDVQMVTLAEAGQHTYYILDDNQDSSSWTADTSKRYVLVSQDKGNPTAGQFMAMYYTGELDPTEGDIKGETNGAWRELNAEPITVMQLPINGQKQIVVSTEDSSFMWTFSSVNKSDGYNWYQVRTLVDQSCSLMLSKGHTEETLQDFDPDNDGIRLRGNATTYGSIWRMSNRGVGLTAVRTDDDTGMDYYFAPYYDSIQGDISVYYTQNGDENMGQRIYLYEETTVNLTAPILAYMKDTNGSVSKGVGLDAGTGDVIYIQNGDQTVTVPVTLNMLSGNFNKDASGTYNSLTVTYAGMTITTNYTLKVNEATTLLKNEGGKFRSTIYRQVEEMVGGRHYLIVDAAEAGEAHAMGANPDKTIKTDKNGNKYATATASAHNVLIQSFTIGGQSGLYIDSTRYSNEPDNPTDSIIVDQGDVTANIDDPAHQTAIRLVWTPSIIHTSPSFSSKAFYNIYCGNLSYRMLISEYQDGRLWISGDRPILYWGGSNDEYERWKYVPTGSGSDHMHEGVVLDSSIVDFRLFYAAETHIDNEVYGDGATNTYQQKNFVTEGTASSPYAPLTRRTWLYEQVDNIDTITARLSDTAGSVVEDRNASAFTGSYIIVETFFTDGTMESVKVPLRTSMLSEVNLNDPNTYNNLTVTYQGKVLSSNYTLTVTRSVPNDKPEFPNEGAVKIDKQLDTTKYKYLETGAASIDLSVTGIPAQSGVDILFVLDTSSSMNRCIHHVEQGKTCSDDPEKGIVGCGTVTDEESRLSLLKQTLVNTLKELQIPIDGYAPDVDVAVACFNGYTPINTDIFLDYTKRVSGDSATTEDLATEFARKRMDSSTVSLSFTDIGKLTEADMQTAADGLYVNAGTNYDRGMEIAYNMLKAKQERDALNGETRQQILVFMSDGIPYQFNYTHGTPWMIDWNNYLMGNSVTAVPADAGAKALFDAYFNKNSTLWMAEAIKGNPNQKYKIINPDLQGSNDKIEYINGLGATIYTVGMGIYGEERVSKDAPNLVLRNIASDETEGKKYFYSCTNPSDFSGTFSDISNTIRKAGNAAFTDQMGPEFDLITANVGKQTVKNQDGTTSVVEQEYNTPPSIVVKQYELYKRSEIGQTLEFENEDGTTTSVTVTEKMVGTRKPVAPAVIETVTFNDDGSAAYSDQRDINGDGVCNDLDNILENDGKVIHAATFWYNKDIQNSQDITVNGTTVALERECFYWNVGDIPQDELVLSYDVYLSGSMEGTRNAGSYKTNAHAELNYTNYLNHPCELTVPTPMLPWKQATVGYGFYLVDDQGNPIINQDTGETGSFEQSIKITQPVYQDFLLNSGTQDIIADIVANENLPDGYTLFDQGAKYQVSLESNGDGMYIITATREDGVQTTYVVGVESTPVTGGDADGEQKNTSNFATANTIVWFGVEAHVQCVPDTVVVDFGLPVDINVLANDTMMGNNGKLQYIGKTDVFAADYAEAKDAAKKAAEEAEKEYVEMKMWEYLQTIKGDDEADVTAVTLEGTYGKLEVLKNEKAETTGELRYTLNDAKAVADAAAEGRTILNGMQMKEEETFVYAVNYTGDGDKGYYYSTVTVIPATTIYYEDSFVTFKVKDYKTTNDLNETWGTAGEKVDATQAEDRPGEFSLSDLDANNIYGYDAAYKNMTEYSLGSARKVNVQTIYNSSNMRATGGKYATAEFTFWGTGFDVISLTSAKTGTIVVQVTGISDAVTNVSKNYVVDTYYGYKYENGKWVVNTNDTETDGNDLYQIPVMKVEDLPYGQYKAVITASHAELFDHKQYDAVPNEENGTITMSYDFYLDAIRIYDPANDGANSEVIEDAYVADGEGWPEYFELRDLLISANTFAEAAANNNTVAGIIFIDGNATLGSGTGSGVDGDVTNNLKPGTTPVVADYANYGPNNELYLARGQAVAFKMEIGTKKDDGTLDTSKIAGIHIALKGVGENVQAKIHNAAVDTTKVPYSNVGTATDLYYDIAQLNGKTLVIYNSPVSEGILSITNIKVTYKEEHADGIENAFFTASQPDANLAAACLMMARPKPVEPDVTEPEETTPETTVPEETTPETTVPEETVPETTAPTEPDEPETFEPRKFNVQLSASSVKVGSNVIVTVTTGTDVDHITVNGEEVSRYTANRWTKTRTWQVKVKAETAGEQAVEVICYNADAVASAPVVKTVTVTQQYTSVSNWLTDVVTGIIGSLLGKWR